MSLDASLEARQVGVTSQYKDSRVGGFTKLPQKLYLIVQGETESDYPTTKFTALSASEVGVKAGYRSLAYLMAKQLLPQNGDGIGTVPLTVALLNDADGADPAVGDITPSGTATTAGAYRVNCNEILSEGFVIPKGAVSVTDTCRKIGNAIQATLGMPLLASYAYGTVTSTKTVTVGTSDGTLATFTTTGNPKPGVWTLGCTAEATNAGTFTLTDPDGVIISTTVTVGAQVQGGLGFTLADGAEDYDVGDTWTITVPATKVTVTCPWAGTTGNELDIRIDGPSYGAEFAYTQPTGGLLDPTVDDALEQIGPNSWQSMVLSGLSIHDAVALDAFEAWGEGRWSPTTKKPAVVFHGNTAATVQEAIVISDARKTDRINSQLTSPGSRNLPQVVAARELAKIIRLANNIPSHDYCLQVADGITPGVDSVQWDLTKRDAALKGGSSTVEVIDDVVRISNVCTFYHPTGEVPASYKYVVDIVKLQNITFAVDTIFSSTEWAGAALVPDDQPVSEPTAKKPKMALAELSGLADNLALAAIISDPAYSKKNMTAVIDSQNPKRLNVRMPVKLSGNTNIIDAVCEWSFNFAG